MSGCADGWQAGVRAGAAEANVPSLAPNGEDSDNAALLAKAPVGQMSWERPKTDDFEGVRDSVTATTGDSEIVTTGESEIVTIGDSEIVTSGD
jgi:hypothetical protein